MSEKLHRFHHVGIVVRDMDASVAWYERHLGFQQRRVYSIPRGKVTHIARDGLRLELLQVDDALPMATDREEVATYLRTGGVNHFAIAVDDLDGTVADLEANGIEIAWRPTDGPEGSDVRFAFIRDNEKMLIELIQETN